MFFHITVKSNPIFDSYEKIYEIIFMHCFKLESSFGQDIYFDYVFSFSFLLLYILCNVV